MPLRVPLKSEHLVASNSAAKEWCAKDGTASNIRLIEAAAAMRSLLLVMNTSLERILQRQLNHTGAHRRAGDLPKSSLVGRYARIRELRVVKQVEKFRSELELLRLMNGKDLRQRNVK